MGSIIPFLTEGQLRFFLLSNRVIQWISSVIVLGITSYFIKTGPRGLTIVYLEVVVRCGLRGSVPNGICVSIPKHTSEDFVLFVDVIFSYLWLAGFIFAAVDYNQNNCHANAPPGVVCSVKWANEAFIFLTFIFTFFALFLETVALWLSRRSQNSPSPHQEKQDPRSSVHSGTRLQSENTVESTASPTQVV
ncbi:hypothetical protein F9C07_2236864 [Aspergillus flavus]|uniref:MARVEL domain-containing protein n=1 Tax=Aspergillus flavus (strain ATCC 200026 / FGSC A1120 / IAM 13836 / NRRL 3357 / JCM 12722 / SRRC 167) TaxID=332952 RepID=A0A7U2MZC4_ASPFN|nr:hypothetical protein F9C07_2236864 [Aspergillus flavus]